MTTQFTTVLAICKCAPTFLDLALLSYVRRYVGYTITYKMIYVQYVSVLLYVYVIE